MKKVFVILLAASACAGCSVFEAVGTGAPVYDVAVTVSKSGELKSALYAAAARRKWKVSEVGGEVYRLEIVQRANRCVIEVTLKGDDSFSILPVESNIPVRKYNQWVDNLRREILHRVRNGARD